MLHHEMARYPEIDVMSSSILFKAIVYGVLDQTIVVRFGETRAFECPLSYLEIDPVNTLLLE